MQPLMQALMHRFAAAQQYQSKILLFFVENPENRRILFCEMTKTDRESEQN